MKCQRCGRCCEKGGPALHTSDLNLLGRGVLAESDLYALRKGELARAPLAENSREGELVVLDREVVKIKSVGPGWACVFYREQERACGLHPDKPLECEALECWNTDKILDLYARDRIGRFDLVKPDSGLGELIREHERKCSYQRLAGLVEDLSGRDSSRAESEIIEIMNYDRLMREVLTQKAGEGVRPRLDFLFGRPLEETIIMFGLKRRETSRGFSLFRAGRNMARIARREG